MYRIIILMVFLSTITGCATNPDVKETTGLKPTEQPRNITISEPLVWSKKKTNWGGVNISQGLLPGIYVSNLENALGTFYRGPERAYYFYDENTGNYYLRKGGFWVPKSNPTEPRLFYIVDMHSVVSVKSLESAIQQNTSTEIAPPAGSSITPPAGLAQGIGYGIGTSIVSAMAESENGRIVLVSPASDNDFTGKLASIVESALQP